MAKKKTLVPTYEGAVDYSKQYTYPGNPKYKPEKAGYYKDKDRVKVREKKVRNKQRSNTVSMGEALGGQRGYPVGVQRKMNYFAKKYREANQQSKRPAVNLKPPQANQVTISAEEVFDSNAAPKSINWQEIKSWQKPKKKFIV